MAIKPRSAITKGRLFQKKVLGRFADTFNLSPDDARTAIGAENGTDIKFNQKTQKIVGLAIECKNVKSLNVWEALKQAQSNCLIGQAPALVFHRSLSGNGLTWIAVPLEHYLAIRKELNDLRVGKKEDGESS